MDKDVERVLLSQLEIQKQKLQNEINELEKQLNDNNMSEQANNPYVEKISETKLEYKSFNNNTIAGLDFDVTEALNEGWQPAGPQYQAQSEFYIQPMIRVPRAMMPKI